MSCVSTPELRQILLASGHTISDTIEVLETKYPSLYTALVELKPVQPNETEIVEYVYGHDLPPVTRDFKSWAPLTATTGCNPCEGNECAYNWNHMGGTGMSAYKTQMMFKDFKTDKFCIDKLQTYDQVEDMIAQTVQNLRLWLDFERDVNLIQTAFVNSAKKVVHTVAGPRVNTANPYEYVNFGANRLKYLSVDVLRYHYEILKAQHAKPIAIQGTNKLFGLMCSQEVLDGLYEDPKTREDLRWAGVSGQFLETYGFQYSIKGMFLPITHEYPRRFKKVATGIVEVAPTISVPSGLAGTEAMPNPDYLDPDIAVYEEVMLLPQSAITIFYTSNKTTLGSGTEFGKQPSFFDQLEFINIKTDCDPDQKMGWFKSGAKAGVSAKNAKSLTALLVERKSLKSLGGFFDQSCVAVPAPSAPCTDGIVDTCPCALFAGDGKPVADLVALGEYFFYVTRPVAGTVGSIVNIALKNGGSVAATLTGISADGYTIKVSFPVGFEVSKCMFAGLCDAVLGCTSIVNSTSACLVTAGNFNLFLKNGVKAVTAGDVIEGIKADGTSVSLTVVSADLVNNIWTVNYTAGNSPAGFPESDVCAEGGFTAVCVPASTDATCNGCAGITVTPCV